MSMGSKLVGIVSSLRNRAYQSAAPPPTEPGVDMLANFELDAEQKELLTSLLTTEAAVDDTGQTSCTLSLTLFELVITLKTPTSAPASATRSSPSSRVGRVPSRVDAAASPTPYAAAAARPLTLSCGDGAAAIGAEGSSEGSAAAGSGPSAAAVPPTSLWLVTELQRLQLEVSMVGGGVESVFTCDHMRVTDRAPGAAKAHENVVSKRVEHLIPEDDAEAPSPNGSAARSRAASGLSGSRSRAASGAQVPDTAPSARPVTRLPSRSSTHDDADDADDVFCDALDTSHFGVGRGSVRERRRSSVESVGSEMYASATSSLAPSPRDSLIGAPPLSTAALAAAARASVPMAPTDAAPVTPAHHHHRHHHDGHHREGGATGGSVALPSPCSSTHPRGRSGSCVSMLPSAIRAPAERSAQLPPSRPRASSVPRHRRNTAGGDPMKTRRVPAIRLGMRRGPVEKVWSYDVRVAPLQATVSYPLLAALSAGLAHMAEPLPPLASLVEAAMRTEPDMPHAEPGREWAARATSGTAEWLQASTSLSPPPSASALQSRACLAGCPAARPAACPSPAAPPDSPPSRACRPWPLPTPGARARRGARRTCCSASRGRVPGAAPSRTTRSRS